MAPRDESIPPGVLRKFPTNRDKIFGTVDDWLEGRESDDGAEGLWRINDDLYDLTTFVTRHPGGRDWIELTRGTDITEAFEVHHLNDKALNMLPKFHVRKASAPRNSLVTFKDDGLYRTLKRRVQGIIKETGPTLATTLLTDTLVSLTITCAILGAWWGYHWSMLGGVFLHMVVVCSHNFFHMKDNFRMYYFNLSLMSYRDWRVSHVLSHHIFPNTILDLEISMWEPMFKYIPDPSKNFTARYLSWLISPILFIIMFHFAYLRRVVEVASSKKLSFRMEELACIAPIFIVFLVSGCSLLTAFISWNVVILVGSSIFGIVGLTAAHHHPDIYHEGDQFTEDKDFAILQLAAVRDRVEVNENFFLVMISFGEHALHHMFPTIDHRRLPALYPALHQTCKEFGIEYKLMPAADMFTGMYQQLARNYRNARLTILKRKES